MKIEFANTVSFAVKQAEGFFESRKEASSRGKRRRWDSNPRRLFTSHDFQSCSLGHYETPPYRDLARFIAPIRLRPEAERVGFEPTRTCALPLFESGTFDHSDISPPPSIAYLKG